jgi:tetratricopeptide (TPR) repeat protein
MKKLLAYLGLAALLALFAVSAARSQGQAPAPAPAQPAPSQPSSGSNRGNSNPQPSQQPNPQQQLPLYVDGQVLTDQGKPPGDPVSIKLSCGMRTLQVIKADMKGNFHFALGVGQQANSDFSAADATPDSAVMSGINLTGGYSGFGTSGSGLSGCELRITPAGYQPLTYIITDLPSLGTIDVGVLELRSTAARVPPGTVSTTSLLVPTNARKEFDQGIKDLQNHRLPQGTQHLEKAVAEYDKYAVAWSELGKAYDVDHQPAKARQAFEKAIAADSRYAPPYVSLAAMQIQDMDNEGAIESIGKAVDADPAILMGVAGYIQSLANFNLGRFDAA